MSLSQQELESRLWDAANSLRGPVDPADFKAYVFPLLFFKWISDTWDLEHARALDEFGDDITPEEEADFHRFTLPDGCHWDDVKTTTANVGVKLRNTLDRIEQANPERLAGIFGDVAWGNKERIPEPALLNLIDAFDGVTLNPEEVPHDMLGAAYEYLLKQFADESGRKAGEFFTPREVVRLLIGILDPQPGETVYDPACGSGGMLVETIGSVRDSGGDTRTLRLYGQEVNLTTAAIARMNLFLHEIEDFEILRGDTLRDPKFREKSGDIRRFYVVVANPPFSLKNWGAETWASDPRAFCGVPPAGYADLAWVQHMVASMDPENGRVGVVMPHGVLFRGAAEKTIRECLVKGDQLDTIVGLPPNLFYSTSIPACLLIFRAQRPEERRGHVLFIDASERFTKGRNQNSMTDDDVIAIRRAAEAVDDPDGDGGVSESISFRTARSRTTGGTSTSPATSRARHPRWSMSTLHLPSYVRRRRNFEKLKPFWTSGSRRPDMTDGWAELTLGEVLALQYGKGLKTADRDGGPFPVYGSAGVVGHHSEPLVKQGPAIIVGRKGTAGAVHWSESPCWPIDTTYWVEPRIASNMGFLKLLLEYLDLPSVCAQTGVPGLNRDRAYELGVRLPPLEEQRRIVSLVEAVDRVADRLAASEASGRQTVDALLTDPPASEGVRELGEVAQLNSGPSWKADQENVEPLPGATPVLKITNTAPDGRVYMGDEVWVERLPHSTRVLDEHSLVLIRTNGNRDRIGNVYRPGPDALGYAVSAFHIRVQPKDPEDRDYLYWFLRSPAIQRAITDAASGTTGLGNIAIGWLKELAVPWPPHAQRRQFVALLNAVNDTIEALVSEAACTARLRTGLLPDLLSGDHRISESYDALVEAVS